MLNSLYIENFAIIDQLNIDFHQGMTVLTGETGAGKSLIIDAIQQLLGSRSQTSLIKKGAAKAFIQGVFNIEHSDDLKPFFDQFDIELDQEIVVSKTINQDGKTTMKINYRPVTQSVIKQLIPLFIDIHSQFDTHQLFNQKNHIRILDQYIGQDIDILKKQYQEVYHQLRRLEKEKNLLENEELSDEQYDFYQSQLKEIDEVDLDNLDEDSLLNEKKKMQDFEKTSTRVQSYLESMTGYQGVMSLFKDALNELTYLSDDETYDRLHSQLYDLFYNIDDINNEIENYYRQFQFDEDRFQEVQDLLFQFNRLKRKYGPDSHAILLARQEIEDKIKRFDDRDALLLQLSQDIQTYQKQALDYAHEISTLRQTKAKQFESDVKDILETLYLPHVQFEFSFENANLSLQGQDDVTMMISTNAGQSAQPLHKVASGGELSRVMLAIKTVCNQFNLVETMIFDEADTGVSGKVAESIGQIMEQIAKKQQVICITHLAQVAGFANHHLLIEKQSQENETDVTIRQLADDESIQELAKMISGKDITEESMQHAKKLKQNHV